VGSGFEPHWRPQPAKLPSFGGYSLETSPNLTYWSSWSLPTLQARIDPALKVKFAYMGCLPKI